MLRPGLHSAGIASAASHSYFLRIYCTFSGYPGVRAARERSAAGFCSALQALQKIEWRGYNFVAAITGSILRIAFLGLQTEPISNALKSGCILVIRPTVYIMSHKEMQKTDVMMSFCLSITNMECRVA